MSGPVAIEVYDSSRSAWRGEGPRPVRALLWRPEGGGPRPLIVVSHGSGGAAVDLAWLAESLVVDGFLVAVVEHHGNTYNDSVPEGTLFWWERPRDLSVVVDHLSATDELTSVGAVGYSLGGYTAAAVLGARIDRDKLGRLHAGDPVLPVPPDRPNFDAEVAGVVVRYGLQAVMDRAVADYRDRRIQAASCSRPRSAPSSTTRASPPSPDR